MHSFPFILSSCNVPSVLHACYNMPNFGGAREGQFVPWRKGLPHTTHTHNHHMRWASLHTLTWWPGSREDLLSSLMYSCAVSNATDCPAAERNTDGQGTTFPVQRDDADLCLQPLTLVVNPSWAQSARAFSNVIQHSGQSWDVSETSAALSHSEHVSARATQKLNHVVSKH